MLSRAGKHHYEFVASQPRHYFAGPAVFPQPRRDSLQDAVACQMPILIVGVLESVKIDQDYRERVAAAGVSAQPPAEDA